jgi:hypothetical protein
MSGTDKAMDMRGREIPMKRLSTVVAAIASGVALVAVPTASATYQSPKLELTQAGRTTTIKASVDPNDDPTAMLQIILPSGTRVTANQAPGTVLGRARAVVKALDHGGADLALEGKVRVATSGEVSAAVKERCMADTRLTATWILALSGAAGEQLAVPVYFVAWQAPPGNIYVCFGPPDVAAGTPGRAPFGAKLSRLELAFTGVFRTVSAGVWVGHFAPYTPFAGVENWTSGVVSPAAVGPIAVSLAARTTGVEANLTGRVSQSGARRSSTVTIFGGSASRKLRLLGTASVASNGGFTFKAKAGTFFRARAVAAPVPAPAVCEQLPFRPRQCVNPTVSGFTAQSRVVRKR